MTDAAEQPRIPPLPASQWSPEMVAALSSLRPDGARHPAPLRGGGRPKGMNALGTLAHHPGLTQAFHSLTGHILFETTLSLRQRELIILRVASLRGSDYEWAQHVVLGLDNGLDRAEILAIAKPEIAATWAPLELAMLQAVDELVDAAAIGDATWRVLAADLDEQQLLDLIFTVGAYDALAMMFRSLRVPMDQDLQDWYAGFEADD